MSAWDRRRSHNRARGGAAATFLRHAKKAESEGRTEDAKWLRFKAAERWEKRKTRPDLPSVESVERTVDAAGFDDPVRPEAMRLLTYLRVKKAGHHSAVLDDMIVALTSTLEKVLP